MGFYERKYVLVTRAGARIDTRRPRSLTCDGLIQIGKTEYLKKPRAIGGQIVMTAMEEGCVHEHKIAERPIANLHAAMPLMR